MKRMVTAVVVSLAVSLFAAERAAEHEHEHGHEHEHDHGHEHGHMHGAAVEVGEESRRAVGLVTVKAEKRRMRSTVSLPGRIELAPDARASASAPVGGRVSLKVRPLAEVEAGAVLFTVDAPELRAKAKEIEVIEQRLKIYRGLNRASAELDSQLALRQAEREAMLAGAEECDGVVSVRSPVPGRVDSLAVTDGAWVSQGATAVELIRLSRVRFRSLVTASEAARLADGMKSECGGKSGTLRIGVGDASGQVPVYVIFDSDPGFRPGERQTAQCVTDESEGPVTAVPSACIIRVGLDPVVFVRDEHDDDRFIAVKVSVGRTGGGWTEVRGLPDDDDLEIVREGAYELKIALSSQSGSSPAGHFHADGTFHESADD